MKRSVLLLLFVLLKKQKGELQAGYHNRTEQEKLLLGPSFFFFIALLFTLLSFRVEKLLRFLLAHWRSFLLVSPFRETRKQMLSLQALRRQDGREYGSGGGGGGNRMQFLSSWLLLCWVVVVGLSRGPAVDVLFALCYYIIPLTFLPPLLSLIFFGGFRVCLQRRRMFCVWFLVWLLAFGLGARWDAS